MKQKLINFTAIFIIQLVITLPFYTASVYGLTISNIRVTRVADNFATIEWNTDNISDGRIKYGKTTALGFTQRHDDFISNHTVTVYNGINSETTYFFTVESTDVAGNTAIDNNSNNFYTFKTTDITPPPQVTGLSVVSTTSDSIFLSWDNIAVPDLHHYVVYRNRVRVANTTINSFNDTGLSPDASFNYKVSAVDASSNEGALSDTLIASISGVDITPPLISSVDVLSITDATAKVTWLTNKNSTTIVRYGINQTDKIKSSSELVTNHSIVIDGLQKNVKHLFIAQSCDASNNCANSSIQNFTGGRDITPPFIDLSIPRYVNRRFIDITGSTEPFSSVTLYVNDMGIPQRSFSNSEVGSSGKFVFSQIKLEQDNAIKVVVVDKSGNKNEKTFEVGIDTENPIVQLDNITSLTSHSNLTISGSVNEPVTIKVFADSNVIEPPTPPKITGLNATIVGQNSVELHWDESQDNDFSHYAVYREGSGPIAITKPADFNLFIDALVDSGKSYTYQVSEVNIFAREGPKSEPITVTTLEGGAVLNLKPPKVDIFEDFRKPFLIANASGKFNFGVKLSKGDTTYNLKLIFEDRALNNVQFERSVTLDTKKPVVKIISPPAGAFIFENVANEVDIIGTTKPNARVHLFVDRTPFGLYNESLEISGLGNEIQSIPESQLNAKCRFNVAQKSFCSTGADFSITADEQGNFNFERVDLTVIFGGAARVREVSPTEFRDQEARLNEEARESKNVKLLVIATDLTGQRGFATQGVRIGTCWSGNQSWNVIPLTQYQSPTFLSTERMAEGTETIYFYFNYSYIGRGHDAKITNINLAKACGTKEVLDPRFNISCEILPSGNGPAKLNEDGTLSYSAITLSRFSNMDKFLEDDWKRFFKAINNELTFPFKLRITYEHEVIDADGVSTRIKETQQTCEQVSYTIDKSVIDPRKVLPDWLLFDFVDFLQDSIKTLTDIQEKINQVLDYVAVACLVSFGLNLVVQIYRRWVSFADEKSYSILKNVKDIAKVAEIFQKNPLKTSNDNDKNYCEETIKKIVEKRGSFKLQYMNDADLGKCFPSTASAWDAEAKVYSGLRWNCDRIFGHAAPAAWTESKDDTELISRVESGEGCAVDQSVRGLPLKAESCRELIASSFPQLPKDSYNPGDKCFKVELNQKRALFKLGNPVSENLYEIEYVPGSGALIEINYAIKKDEFNYLTARSQSCDEVCGLGQQSKKKQLKILGEESSLSVDNKGNEKASLCTTVDKCRSLNAHDTNKKFLSIDNKYHDIKSAEPSGYASDCFYKQGDPFTVVSDSPSQREECCCINSKQGAPAQFYQPDDKDIADETKYVHESKTSEAATGFIPAQNYADMEWSYRYWKEKFQAQGTDGTVHSEYNKNRYIEGRDFPACFGQNNILYDGFNRDNGKVLIVDPFKDHWAALQCVHLAGISQRIQFIKNLMTSMSTCLIQVRTTGRGDAGACKELFTQYLCGAIWQIIRAFVHGCVPLGTGVDIGKTDDEYGIGTYLKAGVGGIYQSMADLQSSLTQEYGNAKLNELLGTGEESVARKICLAAFGYDWEINARNLVDAAYTTPFATLVQPITRSREFLTVDPVSLKPKYEYRASWLINPGCDFDNYDVYLTCVGRRQLDQYPNAVNCGAIGAPSIAYTGGIGKSVGYSQCDCINLADEKVGDIVFSGRKLKQNVLEDQAFHKVVDSNYRYDHLKFVLRTNRKITPRIQPNCFPQGFDDGVFYFPLIDKTARDIEDCTLDFVSGIYSCGGGTAFFSRKGTAELIEITINGDNANKVKELSIGDRLEVGARILKTGKDKCIRVSISPDPIQPEFRGITLNGTNDIPPIVLTERLGVVGTGNVERRNVVVNLKQQNNPDIVSISATFIDDDGDKVYSKGDRVIIDGQKIELGTTQGYQIGETKINVSEMTIRIEKQGAIIEMTGVTYTQSQTGEWGNNEVIKINPPQTITQASQQKTITVEMFHLKGDRDSYNTPDDCNLNDRIFSRPYSFIVSDTKVDKSKLGPIIKNIRNPAEKTVGEDVDISARITHPSGVDKAEITIYDHDNNKVVDSNSMSKVNDDVGWTYTFSTIGKAHGEYSGKIDAVSTNGIKSTSPIFKFKLK